MIPTFTKKRLLRNSEFLLQVAFYSEAKRNILWFEADDFEFRNSLKKVKVGHPVTTPLR